MFMLEEIGGQDWEKNLCTVAFNSELLKLLVKNHGEESEEE